MDFKNLKQVERLIFGLAALTILFFCAGYFVHIFFFYLFLVCILAYVFVWTAFWKCPHCHRRLWMNFDGTCRNCRKDIFEEPAEKLKNTEERTGFFNW